jgi:adenosylhomocysteine nucleosidase
MNRHDPKVTLVCFALPQEAKFFSAQEQPLLITGVGRRNAERAVATVLQNQRPELVLTCGFAGGLHPAWPRGTVVFSADEEARLNEALQATGARPGRFHCADRVATTVAEKQSLRAATGADAVEMESEVIRALCRRQQIPSATIRVISDAADDELPLDFNALMTSTQSIHYGKLAWTLAKSPGKIPALLRLNQQTEQAARNLARTLAQILLKTEAAR